MGQTLLRTTIGEVVTWISTSPPTFSKEIIEGTIKGLGDNSIILMDEKYHPIDTVKAVNDAFIFIHNLEISKPKMQGIFLPQLSNKNGGISKNKAYFFIGVNCYFVRLSYP